MNGKWTVVVIVICQVLLLAVIIYLKVYVLLIF